MIYWNAGVAGVDPGAFTWRELAWMAEGRSRLEWAQSSIMMQFLYAAVRDPKGETLSAADFNPHAKASHERRVPKGPLPTVDFGFIPNKVTMKGSV